MKKLLVGLLTLLALACLPTEPCACTPVIPIESILSGTVTNASGQPVAGAEIRAYVQGLCPVTSTGLWPDNLVRSSDQSGRFSVPGYQRPPADSFCLRVVARRPAPASDSAVVERMVSVAPGALGRPAEFRVDLVLPES
jgi:hypothetical protein